MGNRGKNTAKSDIKNRHSPRNDQKNERKPTRKIPHNKLLENLPNGFWSEITPCRRFPLDKCF